MNITNMPAPVPTGRPAVAPSVKRRVGLIPMGVGTQHNVPIIIDGETRDVACQARPHEDHPRAKVRLFCLHPNCRGKSWGSRDEMVAAHPQASAMAKREEIHVYGMWSDDPQDPRNRQAAEEALRVAEEAQREAREKIKAAKNVGERDLARDDLAQANTAHMQAKMALDAASGCIGLIAPPDGGE